VIITESSRFQAVLHGMRSAFRPAPPCSRMEPVHPLYRDPTSMTAASPHRLGIAIAGQLAVIALCWYCGATMTRVSAITDRRRPHHAAIAEHARTVRRMRERSDRFRRHEPGATGVLGEPRCWAGHQRAPRGSSGPATAPATPPPGPGLQLGSKILRTTRLVTATASCLRARRRAHPAGPGGAYLMARTLVKDSHGTR